MWADLALVGQDGGTGGYRRYAWTGTDATLREWFRGEAFCRGLDVDTSLLHILEGLTLVLTLALPQLFLIPFILFSADAIISALERPQVCDHFAVPTRSTRARAIAPCGSASSSRMEK